MSTVLLRSSKKISKLQFRSTSVFKFRERAATAADLFMKEIRNGFAISAKFFYGYQILLRSKDEL